MDGGEAGGTPLVSSVVGFALLATAVAASGREIRWGRSRTGAASRTPMSRASRLCFAAMAWCAVGVVGCAALGVPYAGWFVLALLACAFATLCSAAIDHARGPEGRHRGRDGGRR